MQQHEIGDDLLHLRARILAVDASRRANEIFAAPVVGPQHQRDEMAASGPIAFALSVETNERAFENLRVYVTKLACPATLRLRRVDVIEANLGVGRQGNASVADPAQHCGGHRR